MVLKKRCEICTAPGPGICAPCETRWDFHETDPHGSEGSMSTRQLMRWAARRAVRLRTATLRVQLSEARTATARLIAEQLQLLDEVQEWQTATGLVGPGGDPSTVTPARMTRYLAQLDTVVSSARALLENDGGPGANYHALRLYDAREALRAALAALPKEQ